MDAMAGTHLVPPSYRPARRRDSTSQQYAPEVRGWLAEYEKQYGPRGTSDDDDRAGAARADLRAGAGDRRHASLVGSTRRATGRVAGDHAGSHPSVRERARRTEGRRRRDVSHRPSRQALQAAAARRGVSGRSAARQERRLAGARSRRDRVSEEAKEFAASPPTRPTWAASIRSGP